MTSSSDDTFVVWAYFTFLKKQKESLNFTQHLWHQFLWKLNIFPMDLIFVDLKAVDSFQTIDYRAKWFDFNVTRKYHAITVDDITQLFQKISFFACLWLLLNKKAIHQSGKERLLQKVDTSKFLFHCDFFSDVTPIYKQGTLLCCCCCSLITLNLVY